VVDCCKNSKSNSQHVMQISNFAKQFLVPTYLLSNSKFVYELAEPAN
jgi:hypothetical protein